MVYLINKMLRNAGLPTYFSMASASVPSLSFSMKAIGKPEQSRAVISQWQHSIYCRYFRTDFGYESHSRVYTKLASKSPSVSRWLPSALL